MMAQLTALLVAHGVLVVSIVSLLVRVGVPMPGAPLLVVAGGMSAMGLIPAWGLLAGAVLATVAGDAVWFVAGRRHGYKVLRLLCRISLSPDSCVRQSEGLISRWGGASLVAAKFLPGVSVVAAPMAGAMGMAWSRFVLFDALAGLLWATLFAGLGALFSTQVQRVLDGLATAGTWAVVAIAVGLAAFVLWRWWRRRAFLEEVAMRRITIDELDALMRDEPAPVVLDVRSRANAEIDPRRIPGALLVELAQVHEHAQHLPRDREIVLYCNCPNEASAARAARLLAGQGLTRVRPLAGGLEAWAASGRPVAAFAFEAARAPHAVPLRRGDTNAT